MRVHAINQSYKEVRVQVRSCIAAVERAFRCQCTAWNVMSEQAGKEGGRRVGDVCLISGGGRNREKGRKGRQGGCFTPLPKRGRRNSAQIPPAQSGSRSGAGGLEEEGGMRQSCHQPLTPADGSTSIMMVVMLYFTACSTKTGTALAALPDSNAGGGIGTQTPLSNPASMSGLQNAIPSYI